MAPTKVTFDADGLIQGVEIEARAIKDLETCGPGDLFCYKGNQVVLYIDQPYKTKGELLDDPMSNSPRIHVKRCRTLVDMDNKGKYDSRYMMTIDTSRVYDLIPYDHFERKHLEDEQVPIKVPVCKNCMSSVNYKNYSAIVSQVERDQFVQEFDLREFFEMHGPHFDRHDYERLDRMPRRGQGEGD